MYADGAIVPITSLYGVKLTTKQIQDYTAGKTIRVDSCQGEWPTLFVKFNPERLVPETSSSNPDAPEQKTSSSFAPSIGHYSHSPSAPENDGCSVSGNDAETWPQFRARHPGLTAKQALDAWRAKRRGKHLNGGFHM